RCSRITREDPPDVRAPAIDAQSLARGGRRPVRILVLTKPVPDPAAGAERLVGADFRLDRAASPTVVNGNDGYALEAALQLGEAQGGEVEILAMAPANATETMRKALAMGAQRGTLVTDPALQGADLPTTIRVLAAAAAKETFDLLLAG